MKKLKLFFITIIMITICVLTSCNQTLNRNQSAAIDLSLWQDGSTSINTLKSYVKDITNEKSNSFIPVKDRIAVFDLDGTLYCEKAPYYAIWQTFVNEALFDDTYITPEDVKLVAEEIAAFTQDSSIPDSIEKAEATAEAIAFAGMTVDEYDAYVKNFLKKDATGFKNMKLADAFYKPMLQLVKYLQNNDFKVYICSGTDRFWVRAAIDGHIDIPKEQVIGMDTTMVAKSQGDTDGLDYVYKPDDYLIRGDQLIIKNVKMNKVAQIIQEIGRQPVLAFGNSSGDISMCTYVTNKNPYKSLAFMVLADDKTREYGNEEKAMKMNETCKGNGWVGISMKNDWKTIYGDDVTKE